MRANRLSFSPWPCSLARELTPPAAIARMRSWGVLHRPLTSGSNEARVTIAKSIAPLLMFDGVAEQAVNLYVSLFAGSINEIVHYRPGELGKEGSVKGADFSIAGRDLICLDSPVTHQFTFTPSLSLFVDCQDEAELERVYKALSEGGQALMPLANYGFSTKFGWVNDRFGVSWQLNLQ